MGAMLVAMLFAFCLTAAAQTQDEAQVQTVTGFRVPDYDEDNNLKSQLFGDFAKVLPNGVIEITQLKIDFYGDELGHTPAGTGGGRHAA